QGASAPAFGTAERDGVLTAREHHIAALVSGGLTNRAIAEQLTVSEGTVRTHVEHILRKLGLQSRAEIQTEPFEVEPGIGLSTKPTDRSVSSTRMLQMSEDVISVTVRSSKGRHQPHVDASPIEPAAAG